MSESGETVDDEPMNIRFTLQSWLGTNRMTMAPSTEPLPPSVMPSPHGMLFSVDLVSGDGQHQRLMFTPDHFNQLIQSGIRSLGEINSAWKEIKEFVDEVAGR